MTSQREVLLRKISDTSEAPKGRDVYYRCLRCGDMVPSQPKENVGCKCGNVFIDIDYVRLVVENFQEFQRVRLVGRKAK
jgi:hypothetical protein